MSAEQVYELYRCGGCGHGLLGEFGVGPFALFSFMRHGNQKCVERIDRPDFTRDAFGLERIESVRVKQNEIDVYLKKGSLEIQPNEQYVEPVYWVDKTLIDILTKR